jgi:hypothetical protein
VAPLLLIYFSLFGFGQANCGEQGPGSGDCITGDNDCGPWLVLWWLSSAEWNVAAEELEAERTPS